MKVFWSYARLDDLGRRPKVSALREAFETALTQAQGKRCKVYCDQVDLNWGAEWRKEIERLVKDSDALVAIVSPSFFRSRMCMYELEMAVAAKKKILPIYYRRSKELKSDFTEDGVDAEMNKRLNKASSVLKKRQMRDFRKLRNDDLESKQVQDFLDELAEQI